MISLIRRKLAVRTALIILGVVAGLGTLIIALAATTTYRDEKARQLEQLGELLNTVVRTTQIAVFLQDSQLAGEITEGLIGNRGVAGVAIRGDEKVLSRAGDIEPRPALLYFSLQPEVLTRPIESPFVEGEIIGEIMLVSNARALGQDIRRSAAYTVMIQFAEFFGLGICIVLVVMRLITHPITSISNRLHNLNITLGEKVPMPSGQHRKDEIGQLVHDVNTMIDSVVKLLNTEKSLRQRIEINEQKFRSIFENATSAIFLVDREGVLLSWNTAFLHLFHLRETQVSGDTPLTIYELAGDQADYLRDLVATTLAGHGNQELEIFIDSEKAMWLKMVLSPVEESTVQIVANEITAFKQEVSEVRRKTALDPLTGLGNRLGLEQQLAALLDPTINHSENALTLFFLDLDKFKEVNDSFGHNAGDAVLVRVAEIIQQLIRKSDYAARLGGDEFVIVLSDVEEDFISTRLARDLLEEIEKPIAVDARNSVQVGVSIGIAYGHPGRVTPEQFLEQADIAMYRAKEQGRHRYCFYDAALPGPDRKD